MSIDIKSQVVLANLKSADPELVLNTVEKIRESGNTLILEGLIELLHSTGVPEIRQSVLTLLSDLKNKVCVPVLVAAITNEKYTDIRKDLVGCCWQNGLDYSEYLPLFIGLVINEEFQISFEAFTLIENMYGRIEDDVLDIETIKINEALKAASDEKAYLLNSLLTIIRDIPEEQAYSG
jgi:hypothetical protein